jgi:thiol-disulfide isomerase/thioredoxin
MRKPILRHSLTVVSRTMLSSWCTPAIVLLLGIYVADASNVLTLTSETYPSELESHTRLLIMFHSPSCGHCKKLAPDFEKAAVSLNDVIDAKGVKLSVKLGEMECPKNREFCQNLGIEVYISSDLSTAIYNLFTSFYHITAHVFDYPFFHYFFASNCFFIFRVDVENI